MTLDREILYHFIFLFSAFKGLPKLFLTLFRKGYGDLCLLMAHTYLTYFMYVVDFILFMEGNTR